MCTSERAVFNVLKTEVYPINNQNSLLISQKKYFPILLLVFVLLFIFLVFVVVVVLLLLLRWHYSPVRTLVSSCFPIMEKNG